MLVPPNQTDPRMFLLQEHTAEMHESPKRGPNTVVHTASPLGPGDEVQLAQKDGPVGRVLL